MQINSIQNSNSPSFNAAMLKIKHPTRVTDIINRNLVLSNAKEMLINPEAIEAILPHADNKSLSITTKTLCYEVFTDIKSDTLEKLDAACAKAKTLNVYSKAVDFIN